MRDLDQPGRSAAISENGMAATSHPDATLTAVDVLRSGETPLTLAAVAVLGVVESAMTGVGGDCFVPFSKAGAGRPVVRVVPRRKQPLSGFRNRNCGDRWDHRIPLLFRARMLVPPVGGLHQGSG